MPTVIAAEVTIGLPRRWGGARRTPRTGVEGASRGTRRPTYTANLRAGERGAAVLQEAEAELFRTQLAKGSRTVYDRSFSYWAIWRACRYRVPCVQGGAKGFEDEGGAIKFVAYFGVVC